jgi:hypothetical protein
MPNLENNILPHSDCGYKRHGIHDIIVLSFWISIIHEIGWEGIDGTSFCQAKKSPKR